MALSRDMPGVRAILLLVISMHVSHQGLQAVTAELTSPTLANVTNQPDFDECASNPCLNGATCVDGLFGYSCTCAPKFRGDKCEVEICGDRECRNGAPCVDDRQCVCPIGFYGDDCGISSGVCVRDIDVRNGPKHLHFLRGCRVIEGNLIFVLIDKADPREYENFTFPELREITGYFLLYRVSNLTTLSYLFPNLAVIGGNTLMFNYALVIYEMYQLENIGLKSLTRISRGAIRIEKNPSLCFIDTVSWGSILNPEDVENNIITENKHQSECFNYCPNFSQRQCQRRLPHGSVQELCWNGQDCQRICHHSCPHSCHLDNPSQCCHGECLGGCHGSLPSQCVACKNFRHEGTCVKSCPPGTVQLWNRYCIPPKDCPEDHKLFNNLCSMACPPGYTDDLVDNRSCTECQGTCPKECDGKSIESLTDLESMFGCTKIRGTLTITLQGGQNTVKKLEPFLGSIEEITGSLAIIRSFSLISLSFLKNLKVIRGEELEKEEYSVFIHDNRNLQDLFPTHQPNFSISQGKIFAHSNPKLCPNKIEDFATMAGHPTNETGLSTGTNGYMVACSVLPMNLTIEVISLVVVRWKIPQKVRNEIGDMRNILGFVVSYRVAPFQNVTEFDGEETCGQSLWDTRYAEPNEFRMYMTGLKAATQYAVYVQSYAISSAEKGVKTNIYYFTTSEQEPDAPTNLMIQAISPSRLRITWGLPENPNGNVTTYVVTWSKQAQQIYGDIDLCVGKLPSSNPHDPLLTTDVVPLAEEDPSGECDCNNGDTANLKGDEEARNQITFENALHNYIFVSRPDTRTKRRKRREVSATEGPAPNLVDPGSDNAFNVTGITPQQGNTSATVTFTPGTPAPPPNRAEVLMGMSYEITGLGHFEQFIVKVVACNSKFCSTKRGVAFGRTLPKENADDIVSDIYTNITSQERGEHVVFVTWEPPLAANGVVLKYEVELTKDTDSAAMTTATPNGEKNVTALKQEGTTEDLCITAHNFDEQGGLWLELDDSGEYTLRLRAATLAGYGYWSRVHALSVPHLPEEPVRPVPNTFLQQLPWLIFGVIAALILLVICIVFLRYRYRKDQTPDTVLYASANPEYLSTNEVYVADEWEFPREKLTVVQELGKGGFGMVYQGLAHKILPEEEKTTVAVKSVRANASLRDRIEFLNEASVMKAINTHHVVRLLGVVSKGQPAYVIMEYMAQGDLKNWLRARRAENQQDLPLMERKHPPTYPEVIKMSAEIADGMAYLGANKFVHRDLSARNCLVGDDGTCKVADFGLARDIYQSDYYRKEKGGMLPIRWMAPESVRDGVFTISTDVWSYGILLWEIASLGEMPYGGLNNEGAGEYIKQGRILNMPEGCPEKLQELMLGCWAFQEKLRPTFNDIVNSLESTGFFPATFRVVSFFHSQERLAEQRGSTCSADLEQATMLPNNGMNDYTYMDKGANRPRNGMIPNNGRLPGSRASPNHGSPNHMTSSLEHSSSSPDGEGQGSPSIRKCTEC